MPQVINTKLFIRWFYVGYYYFLQEHGNLNFNKPILKQLNHSTRSYYLKDVESGYLVIFSNRYTKDAVINHHFFQYLPQTWLNLEASNSLETMLYQRIKTKTDSTQRIKSLDLNWSIFKLTYLSAVNLYDIKMSSIF